MAKKSTKRKPKTRERSLEDLDRYYQLLNRRRAMREQRELARLTKQFRAAIYNHNVELRGLYEDLRNHFADPLPPEATDDKLDVEPVNR